MLYPFILAAALYCIAFLYGNSAHLATTLEQVLSAEIPGSFRFPVIELGPDLRSVRVHGAELLHADGRSIVTIEETRARLDPLPLFAGRVALAPVTLRRPRVLMPFDDKGNNALLESLTDPRSGDPRDEGTPPPFLLFEQVRVEDADVLVQPPGLAVRLEHVLVSDARVLITPGGQIAIRGDVHAPSGRIVVLPELFGLVDPRETNALRRYRTLRRADPWAAADAELPQRVGDDYGALAIPLRDFDASSFQLASEQIRVNRLDFELFGGDRLRLQIRNFDFRNTVPKDDEIGYSAQGLLEVAPDSPLLRYFAEDLLAPRVGSPAAPTTPRVTLGFDVVGSLASIGGELAVGLRDVTFAGFPIEEAVIPLLTERGGPFRTDAAAGNLRMATAGADWVVEGWFDPADGAYELATWIDGLDVDRLLADLSAPGEAPAPLGGALSTTPATPAEGPSGLVLRGDLDAKAFLDFEAGRRERRRLRPLLEARLLGLAWTRAASPDLPVERLALSGLASLDAGGRLTLGEGRTAPLRVGLDGDEVAISGVLDLLTQRFESTRVEGQLRHLAPYLGDAFDASASARLSVSGPFDDPTVEVERLSLARFLLDDLRIGELVTRLDARGLTGTPRLERGSVELTDVSFGEWEASSLSMDYALVDDWLRIDDAELRTSIGDASIGGRVRLRDGAGFLDDPRLDLSVRARDVELAALAPDLDVVGSLDAEAELGGSASRPTARGHLRLREAILFDEWVDWIEADVDYSPNGLRVDDLTVYLDATPETDPTAVPVITGNVALDRDLGLERGALHVAGLRLGSLQSLADTGLEVEGRARLDLTLEPVGADERIPGLEAIYPAPGLPDIEGDLSIRDLRLDGRDIGALALTMDTYGETLHAVGQVGGELDLRLELPLRGEQRLSLVGTFDHLRLAELVPGLGDVIDRGEANAGRIEVSYEPEGGGLRVKLRTDLSLGVGTTDFQTVGPAQLSYTNGLENEFGATELLRVPRLRFGTGATEVALSGQIIDWETLDLEFAGDIDLSLAPLFTEAIAEGRGRVRFRDIHIGGSPEAPMPTGFVEFDEARLAVRGLGDELVIERGELGLSSEGEGLLTVLIDAEEPLRGRLFGGIFTLSGFTLFDHLMPEESGLEIIATNMTYRIPEEATLTLSLADLYLYASDLSGTPEFILSGNVFLEEGLYFKNFAGLGGAVTSTLVSLFDREVELYEVPIWEEVPLLENLSFDLAIKAPDRLFVRNEVLDARLDLELHVDLVLQGTLVHPVLLGEVRVLEGGEIRYQNRTFTIQSCTLLFDSETEIRPRFENCIAEASIEPAVVRDDGTSLAGIDSSLARDHTSATEPYIIQVRLEGDPAALEFQLESLNRALTEADVLSLIFTGYTLDEFSSASAGQPSFEIVFRQLTDLIESELRDTLALSDLRIIPSVGGATTVYVSSDVTRRLNVNFDTTVFGEQDEGSQALSGTYTIFDWLILEVFFEREGDQDNTGGGRLRFPFELD